MDHNDPKLTEGYESFILQMVEQKQQRSDDGYSNIFEPRRESSDPMENKDSSYAGSVVRKRRITPAPEKELTLFALRLAVLEKIACGLGTIGFIWATVVLLGGFAVSLEKTDFWFITVILLIEGTRIFSRSHELEWQHQATWSITDCGKHSFRAFKSSSHFLFRAVKAKFCSLCTIRPQNHDERELTCSRHTKKVIIQEFQRVPTRTWTTSDVPILPYVKWVFLTKNISKILYGLQLLSASACVTLSLIKLINHNFGEVHEKDGQTWNRNASLNVFYALAFLEAMLSLLEKAYWEWKVFFCGLLEQVNRDCHFEPSGMVSIRRFFYDAYSKSINGSIFDGLKMDLVSFGMELLTSESSDEQLTGIRILQRFATSHLYCDDTLQKIGISLSVMERLVDMLNWKDSEQEEIRRSAAEILSKLAGKKQNSLRVAEIPGAMESISSLLYIDRNCTNAADEISQQSVICDQVNYEFSVFNHLGLLILKKLARDHDNCGKIGNTRGLLQKIIDFTHAEERLLKNDLVPVSQIMTVKLSLQVIKMLACTTGNTGKLLRREISEIVFTFSNIRDILRYGEKHPTLQKLGIGILTNLALEEEATERIGSTGSVLKELFNIFFKQGMPESQNPVRVVAGEALAMLLLDSKRNCDRILKLDVVTKLVAALEDRVLCVNAARILRNLCTYTDHDCFHQLSGVAAAAPTVLQAIMSEENKLQEVMLGLAAQVFKFMASQESSIVFEQTGITETELATKLVQILNLYAYPPLRVPRIRRYAVELAIWMMRDKQEHIHIFKSLGLEQELEGVLETTSELESFNVFSGTTGLNRHSTSIHSLVVTALKLLADG